MINATDPPITRALISVSDKSGLLEFAEFLNRNGVEILSTGGTGRLLSSEGIPVVEVSEHTGFPELMDGRVKTLHPKIHGGILGRRGIDDEVMYDHAIPAIDLVVVNLYPFEETVARPGCSLTDAIDNIDIGGPTLLRAAAKNYERVTVVTHPEDYPRIIDDMKANQSSTSLNLRFDLAVKAFELTTRYDGAIANHLGGLIDEQAGFPRTLSLQFEKLQAMRYGENPHQSAAFYREHKPGETSVSSARQLQGKALSYNNIADTDAALECVKQFDAPACVIVKHANPCGVAVTDSILKAYDLAFSTDPASAFGGIIAFNRALDEKTAATVIERQFAEVLIAPKVDEAARSVLSQKKNLRVMECGLLEPPSQALDFKRVNGGLLAQKRDLGMPQAKDLKIVTDKAPTDAELQDLLFAWRVVKFVKSNAIVYAKGGRTIGIGAGQMSRVYSAKIAAIKAADEQLEVKGAVMASDAFFPFRDGIDAAHEAGISAVIEPGGSVRDEEVIAAANEHGMAMVFTGMRHFRH